MAEDNAPIQNDKKKSKKKREKQASTIRDNNNVIKWLTIFKIIKAFPLKALLVVSSILGGGLVALYFDYINYQPDLDIVHFSFLTAQTLLAGALVTVAFLMLFVSTLMGSNSPATNDEREENSTPRGRFSAFVLIALAHFPILFIIYATASTQVNERYWWWWGLSVWAIVFCLSCFYRYKIIQGACKQRMASEDAGKTDQSTATPDDEVTKPLTNKPQKVSPAWATLVGELLANLGVMVFSAPALMLLLIIMEVSPSSSQNRDIDLWMIWGLIAIVSGLCSLGKSIPIYGKMMMMGGAILLILSFLQALHLPVVAIAKIAGIGQIRNVDLTLSDTRCLIVKRQLIAAGISDRLICQEDQHVANTAKENSSAKTAGVLQKVLILSRVGNEYYVEISKGMRQTSSNHNPASSTSAQAAPSESENKVEIEDVVRLTIPKSDATDLEQATRTLSTNEAEQYRKKLKEKFKPAT